MKYSADITREGKYVDREISWLMFNHRVLQEAADKNVPLLMRLKFLGIFSNNLDEFFRVRVASLKRIVDLKKKAKIALGFDPKVILEEIQQIVIEQQEQFEKIYGEIKAELANKNVFIVNEKELTIKQGLAVRSYFHDKVRPLLVPLMLDGLAQFPQLKDGSIYLSVYMKPKSKNKEARYALIELPTNKLSRFFVFERSHNRTFVILLDDVIRYCLDDIFGIFGFKECKAYTIKITKDAEMDFDNDVSKSFLELVTIGVKRRKLGRPVRLIHDQKIKPDLLNYLIEELNLTKNDNIIAGGRYHNFKNFMEFPDLGAMELRPISRTAIKHRYINPMKSIFKTLRDRDIMLHFPYHSFHPIIDFVREAAIDTEVVFIKATLYRLASGSNIINALINACKNGKQVTVIIELQARFDEEANIKWAKILQEAGIKVIHGRQGMKVHSKLVLVGRREKGIIRHYASIGTGNFHEGTAKLYADENLLTTHKGITKEVYKVFQMMESNQLKTFKHLLVSPYYMHQRYTELIDIEIENAKAGKKAFIIAKMNSLNEEAMINKLYEASQAGVTIRLIVRGICSLIPGVPGLSENIEAISIVDGYLEHSRIYMFCHGGEEKCYISSADWLERNLHRRIEVACPIYDDEIKLELKSMLSIQLKDNTKARWQNHSSGKNVYKKDKKDPFNSQAVTHAFFQDQLERHLAQKQTEESKEKEEKK